MSEAKGFFPRIEDWETGRSAPTYPQLEQLAEKLKLPIAAFFFPEPPTLPEINQTFRTLPDGEIEQMPSRMRFLLRKAKALQINLAELCSNTNPAPRLVTRDLQFSEDVTARQMATRVREYLQVPVAAQVAWASVDIALQAWRDAFVAVGVFVFKDAFRVPDYFGFCLYDETFPIIYVNNSVAKTRQMFTMAHELAHLVFKTSGIDTPEDAYIPQLSQRAKKIEVLCNAFAAELLLPEVDFDAALAGKAPNEATAEALALRFHVSREFIFRRFLDRRLISQAQYREAAERWSQQRQPSSSGGNSYWTHISYLGRDYMNLVFREYQSNRISEGQVAEYLEWKPRNLAKLEEYFERVGA